MKTNSLTLGSAMNTTVAGQEQLQQEQYSQRVRDAIVAAGGGSHDTLDPEQDARARQASRPHKPAMPGLRNRSLGIWVLEGKNTRQQIEEGRLADALARKEDRSESASVSAMERPSDYTVEIRESVKIAKQVRGTTHGAGPKQHQAIRKVVREVLIDQDIKVSPGALLDLAGVDSAQELEAIARGEGGRDATVPLRLLGALMPEGDGWTRGRHLAAALAAWGRQKFAKDWPGAVRSDEAQVPVRAEDGTLVKWQDAGS